MFVSAISYITDHYFQKDSLLRDATQRKRGVNFLNPKIKELLDLINHYQHVIEAGLDPIHPDAKLRDLNRFVNNIKAKISSLS